MALATLGQRARWYANCSDGVQLTWVDESLRFLEGHREVRNDYLPEYLQVVKFCESLARSQNMSTL